MTRDIDLDPFALTVEEKLFRIGKRICIVFAVAALAISTLDLMNVRPVENAAEYINGSRPRFADLPDRIRTGIREISIFPSSPSVTVAIPRDTYIDKPKLAFSPPAAPARPVIAPPAPAPRIAVSPPPPVSVKATSIAAKSDPSPVAELAAARHMDAVEFAMASPAALVEPQPALLSYPAPVRIGAPPPDSIRLASIDPGAMPGATPAVAIAPMSIPTLPAVISVLPPPAPGLPPPSPAQRLKLEGKEYARAERCLANAIYFESRSEPLRGQIAVAQVVINRVFSPFYPNDVCGVVYQNAHRRLSCQFTFACDGKSKAIHERGAWARANRIAKQTLHGQLYLPDVGTSTHYHATYVRPYWVREMRKNVRYGIHNFYRPIAWGNGADEPVWARAALAVGNGTKKR